MEMEGESVDGVSWLLSLAGFVEEDRDPPTLFYHLSMECLLLVRTVCRKRGHYLPPADGLGM